MTPPVTVEHTPEPWEQAQSFSIKAGGEVVAETKARLGYYRDSPRRQELVLQDSYNARRIVAAVNACAGISIEDLERFTENQLRDALQAFSMI